MNPKREINPSIAEGIEMVANDSGNPTPEPSQASKKAAELADSFVAEQLMEEEEILAKEFDSAVKDVMILTGKTLKEEPVTDKEKLDKKFYETMTRDRDAYIKLAIKRSLDKHAPLSDAKGELDDLLNSASVN